MPIHGKVAKGVCGKSHRSRGKEALCGARAGHSWKGVKGSLSMKEKDLFWTHQEFP